MSELFRKKALDRLSSPDRLDERVALIAPSWWVALAALFGMLGVAALWGAFSRISTKVDGSGMLLEESGFQNVVSLSDGVMGALNVQEGSPVQKGDVLATVSLPLQQMELDSFREKLETLRTEWNELHAAAEQHRTNRAAFHESMRASNAESVEKLAQILEKLKQLSDTYAELSGRGIVTQVESLRLLQDMLNGALQIAQQQQENMRADVEKADFDLDFKRDFWQRQQKLMDAEMELKLKMARLLSQTLILSPAQGTIVNVQKSAGDKVSDGEVVFLLQPASSGTLHASAFIPAAKSKNVQEGQPVLVSPANAEPQRTGYMRGVVERVGRYPATFEQLMNVFKNQDLTQMLKGEEAAVTLEVRLIPDAGNPTGYQWTGKAPEGVRISAGTLCHVAVVVEQRAPLSYVLPWIRKTWLGEVPHGMGSKAVP